MCLAVWGMRRTERVSHRVSFGVSAKSELCLGDCNWVVQEPLGAIAHGSSCSPSMVPPGQGVEQKGGVGARNADPQGVALSTCV